MLMQGILEMYEGTGVAVIRWGLDLQLHMQSVPITTDAVSSNLDQGIFRFHFII